MDPVQYRGYTIQEDQRNPYAQKGEVEFMFYPTKAGIQHDGDFDGEDWHYCGNCKWEAELQYAKEAIDEIWDMKEFPLAEDMGIKRGDTMFTGRGDEVVVVSTSTVPLTKNQIVVRQVKEKHSFYICADSLYCERPLNPVR